MAFTGHWSTPAYESDPIYERDDVAEREPNAAELFELAADAQAMAQLRYDDYRCRRDRDDYEHNLIAAQERCRQAYARCRALYDMAAAEVVP